MNLKPHEKRDGEMKVWLSQAETDALLDVAGDTEQTVAIALGVRCGLRSHEVLDVTPEHVVDTDAGPTLRVWHGKGDKFRETPIPRDLFTQLNTIRDVRSESPSEPFVSTSSTRTLRRWLKRAAERAHEQQPDDGWRYLSFHDLRRTWATALSSADVDPLLVCDWGGWNDLDTFLEHYRGTHSPEAQARERDKVEWL